MGKGKTKKDFEDYAGFVEKFKPKKTTDDCYTPEGVYNAVLGFVGERLADLHGREVVRPFWPGGDYKNYDYPEGCVVVDNPPFSIYSKILRFYTARGIDFFLFGPGLTLFRDTDCTYVLTNSSIRYENGAVVKTGFATNMAGDLRVWSCPELARRIKEAQEESKPKRAIRKISCPDELVSSALLTKIADKAELKIRKGEAFYTSYIGGNKIYGGAFIISERAAAERAAAERAAAERIVLGEREKEIIMGLRPQTGFENNLNGIEI